MTGSATRLSDCRVTAWCEVDCANAVTPVASSDKIDIRERRRTEKKRPGPSMRLLRRQLLRAPRLLVCLGSQSLRGQRFGQRLMHDRLLRRQLDGATQLRNCFINFVLIEKSLAQGAMAARKFRINRDRLPKRLLPPAPVASSA